MKLALVQMECTPDRDSNVERACSYIDEAVDSGPPDLIVLPEFFNIPYVFQYRDPKYIGLAERDDGDTMARIRGKAREHGVYVVATIFEEASAGIYYDTAMLVDPDGEIVGKYRKVHPGAVRSLEKLYFRYGSRFSVFKVGEWRVGINICYDASFPEATRCAAVNGAELIVVPYGTPARHWWRDMMVTRAFENGVYFAPCNRVGRNGDWVFAGRSMIVDPTGVVVAEASADRNEIIAAELDRDLVFRARRERPNIRDRRPELYGPLVTATEDIEPIA